MFHHNDFGFVTETLCPFCGQPFPSDWKWDTPLRCEACGGVTTIRKSEQRVEWEKTMREEVNEPRIKETVTQEEVNQALHVVRVFRCKKGWNPKFCKVELCGVDDGECLQYFAAASLVRNVEAGFVCVVSDSRAWQL